MARDEPACFCGLLKLVLEVLRFFQYEDKHTKFLDYKTC